MKIVAIGECMAELTEGAPGSFTMAFAGDTYNTAVYLRRLLTNEFQVHFVTATGDDWMSDRQMAMMKSEGLIVDAARIGQTSPALYFVRTDEVGERSFTYYREASPMRHMLEPAWNVDLTNNLDSFGLLYFSAITLQMLTTRARQTLLELIRGARANGTIVAFDSNYRPRGWSSAGAAKLAIGAAMSVTDIALPSLADELSLDPSATPSSILHDYERAGVGEIVLKDGGRDVLVCAGGKTARLEVSRLERPRDTTGAGDSFNAGYLAGRITGKSPEECVAIGHSLAQIVVSSVGAIAPRSVLPDGTALSKRFASDEEVRSGSTGGLR